MQGERTHLVVAIDFSEGSLGALREGRWLASRAGLEISLLHVTDNGTSWAADAPEQEWMRMAPVESRSVVIRRGRPWIEIVRYAHEISAAAIVLGSHGASGMQPLSLGSTASRVALRATCPVVLAAPSWSEHPSAHQSNH